ncbi:MAG: chromosomal replication initiator protein DnaA [Clostridia bacterium]|nr:chromosomal replication initiator protein DnaA [Clostridia bacterium]
MAALETNHNVNLVSYQVYLQSLEPLEVRESTLVLISPTEMCLRAVKEHYMTELRNAVFSVNPYVNEIKILSSHDLGEYMRTHTLPESEEEEPAADFTLLQEEEELKFNPKYTFESFVVGKSNQFVTAAAMAVAKDPGKAYNPLFIYGESGLGKTHLMHAIGNSLRKTRPELRVFYTTSERFVNELVDAIKEGSIRGEDSSKRFREKYRSVDVLMIDDIQFIENKPSTQEEFFHTFNDLHQNGKQIIISSDRAPQYLSELQDRLRTRFQWGMTADIQPPELETRIAILKKKAESEKYNVDESVYDYIASQPIHNIREMEGILARITLYASLTGKQKVELADATEALKDYVESKKETLTIDRVIDVVCEYYGITKEGICGKRRNKELVEPRQVCMYVITQLIPTLPLVSIGQTLGGRDHTTVMHARDKVAKEIETNAKCKIAVEDIRQRLTGGR